jgi:hypothetical protein
MKSKLEQKYQTTIEKLAFNVWLSKEAIEYINSLSVPLEGLEVLQNTDQNGLITTSFVCLNEAEQINQLERVMDIIISTNIEREEKEKLFKSKVQELQTIFEKENLENLKGLKFDIDQLVNLYKNNDDEISIGDEKSVEQTA